MCSSDLAAVTSRCWSAARSRSRSARPACAGTTGPNPTTGPTAFLFTTDTEEETTFEIWNMSGAMVTSRQLGTLSAGRQRIEWDAAGNKAGMYLYRIISGSAVVTGKVMVE